MPLPDNNIPWPPRELANVTPSMQQWSAWYEGTPEALQEAYGRLGGTSNYPGDARVTFARDQRYGGLRGVLQRFWWGRPINNLSGLTRDMLHVPIASDLCQGSADLLFAEQPTFTVDKANKQTQARLDELANDGMYSTLAEAAEIAAALGGVYLRVTWDKNIADAPFLTSVDADAAWPEFQWDSLRAVTFWQVVQINGQVVQRHLERHELDSQGNGIIIHGLYEGGPLTLGRQVPLNESPATKVFVDALNGDGIISTESPGLAVEYIPNQRPQRRWRKDPVGRSFGRSDLDGVEGLMDALDETYSSWMRDVRLGKARILIAKSMIENLGAGKGSTFDAEQEVFAPVDALMQPGGSGLPIEQVQFAIRVQEHQSTAQQLVDDILRTAGYSTQTFGEGDTGNIRTATEVEQRERRSLLTRDRKIRHFRPGIANSLEKLLAVDKALFSGKAEVERPDVGFADGVSETPLNLAQTALALRQAEAASTEVLVALVHPDWDGDDVKAEAAKILAEKSMSVPAPDMHQGALLDGMDASETATATAEDDPTGSQQQ